MQLENIYFYFKSALTPEQCQRIIDLGNSKIFSGGTTFGKTEKDEMPDAKPINDKTFSDLDVEKNQEVLKNTYTRDSEGSYKGGNLKFDFGPHSHGKRYHECVEIRPQGSVIVFPSYIYHQVTPVTEGTRYSLVMWTLGKPFK